MQYNMQERSQSGTEGSELSFFNKLRGDFNGDKIIPAEDAIHNPIPARVMTVSIAQDMTLEEEIELGASVRL